MGLFDFAKKDSRLEETIKRLGALFTSENGKDEFEEYCKNIKDASQIPFGNLDLFEQVITLATKSNNSFPNFLKIATKLYKKIVFDKNDKSQENLFIDFLKLINTSPISYNDAIKINGLFQNKGLLLNLINSFETSTDNTIKALINYMCRARQYYVDDSAFVSSCLNMLERINNEVFDSYDEIIEEKIAEDMQLAGIYKNISPDTINDLVSKYNILDGELVSLQSRFGDANKKLSDLISSIKEIKGLSDDKKQELLDEIKSYRDMFEKEKAAVNNSIEQVGEKYLGLIEKKMGVNTVRTSLKSNGSADNKPVRALDNSIPAKIRFEETKAKKQGLYHYCFDDVMKQVLISKSVYLVGPGGSGKTTIVAQLAELLGIKLYNIGFVADEFTSIKGYMDSVGNFVKTPFYTAFKEGGLFFLDEIDNSESKALIELNKFVTNEGYKPYLFPNDEIVTPHPNFRLVAAGNTWGDGADISYSTRENLDASTLRRMPQVYCGFDENLEKAMFNCNDSEMFKFCMAFRAALNKREGNDNFSTGDLADINSYLKSGIFDINEIINLEFIKNRRIETLKNICSDMETSMHNNEYYEAFSRHVTEKGAGQFVKRRI